MAWDSQSHWKSHGLQGKRWYPRHTSSQECQLKSQWELQLCLPAGHQVTLMIHSSDTQFGLTSNSRMKHCTSARSESWWLTPSQRGKAASWWGSGCALENMGSRQQGGCGSEKYQLLVLAGGDGGGTDKSLGSKPSRCKGLGFRGVGIPRDSRFGDWELFSAYSVSSSGFTNQGISISGRLSEFSSKRFP